MLPVCTIAVGTSGRLMKLVLVQCRWLPLDSARAGEWDDTFWDRITFITSAIRGKAIPNTRRTSTTFPPMLIGKAATIRRRTPCTFGGPRCPEASSSIMRPPRSQGQVLIAVNYAGHLAEPAESKLKEYARRGKGKSIVSNLHILLICYFQLKGAIRAASSGPRYSTAGSGDRHPIAGMPFLFRL